MQLFAFYSNHYIATRKSKIRLDINNLNAMHFWFMNPKNLIRFNDFFCLMN